MSFEIELTSEIGKKGADFVHFVNISKLPKTQNKGFPTAILFGIGLTPKYLQKITNSPDYVQNMIRDKLMHQDEFDLTEKKTDALADYLENYLKQKGFSAYSQSEKNIEQTGFYDKKNHRTPLPHKTIALMAGLGWIGKHNLLVTPEYGSAISMCTVLTNAPLSTVLFEPEESQCGTCNICINICHVNALKGKTWNIGTQRDEMVDVKKCTTCLKCMVVCPWTQNYMKKKQNIKVTYTKKPLTLL